MPGSHKDPTQAIRLKASRYPGVADGTSCTQTSFKAGGKAFLYIGMQGGRYKAMVKLRESMPEATKLAKQDPNSYEVGSTGWVTARFTAESPWPKRLWEKWLDESYELSHGAAAGKKPATKKGSKKTATGKRVGKKAKPKARKQ
jgi:hypothetical protein